MKHEGEQLGLGLDNTSAPPPTRHECGELARPCPRFACKHHLYVETEREGRPWEGVHNAPRIVPKSESCALDVVDSHPDGIGFTRIGNMLEMTRRRAQQLGDRALLKVKTGKVIEEWIQELREKLPRGAVVDSVYPQQMDGGAIVLGVVIAINPEAK